MNICNVNIEKDVLLIAEIGNNHEGDIVLAHEMIAAAAEAGAHVAKFQTITPEHLVTADQVDRLAQLKGFCFSPDQIYELSKTAKRHGVGFMSTPFSKTAVDVLDPIVPAFKIASSDNDYLPLLQHVARTGKPVMVSTGLCDYGQALKVREVFKTTWQEEGIKNGKLILLHCVTSYPTPPNEASLGAINALKKIGVPVGYSDHTLGIEAAALSVAMGARVIEKHFTLNKENSTFRDHQLSADPADMAELSRRIKEILTLVGDQVKTVMPAEKAIEKAVRRGVYAARDLAVGDVLQDEDVDCLRPRIDFSPMDLPKFLGKPLRRTLSKGAALSEEDFN
ncbi:MAG: N-acetylneuraminate synthase family protein [Phycisphaeraceae bacterium]|nr:N-acetylneuraminate synthase family protein [Phycisphaeraceae bacterium]